MSNAICNETVLTTFANLTPWVQGLTIGGTLVMMVVIASLLTKTRRHIQEHVYYVAEGKPKG